MLVFLLPLSFFLTSTRNDFLAIVDDDSYGTPLAFVLLTVFALSDSATE